MGCLRALILLVGAWPSGPVPSRDFNCPRVLRAMILLVGAWPSGPVPSKDFSAPGSGSAQAPLDNSDGAVGSSVFSPHWSCGVTADRGAGRPGSAFSRFGFFSWIAVAWRP